MGVTIDMIKKKHSWAYIIEHKNGRYSFVNYLGHTVDEASTLEELDEMIDEYAENPGAYVDKQLKDNYGDYYNK